MTIPFHLPPWLGPVGTLVLLGCLLRGLWLVWPTQAIQTWPDISITMVAPDGTLVKPFPGPVEGYDPAAPLPTLRQTFPQLGYVTAIAFSGDGQWLLVGKDGGLVQLWSLPEQRMVQEWSIDAPNASEPKVNRVAINRDGSLVNWAGRYLHLNPEPSHSHYAVYELRNLHTGAVLTSLRYPSRERRSPGKTLFSPDGQYIIQVGDVLQVQHGASQRILYRIPLRGTRIDPTIAVVAVSPNQQWLALAYTNSTIALHRFEDGAVVRVIKIPRHWYYTSTPYAYALAFSPDSRLLAAAVPYPNRSDTPAPGLELWEPVRLWDVASGQQVQQVAGHVRGAHTVVFTNDGRTLITTGEDGTRFWPIQPQNPWEAPAWLLSGLVLIAILVGRWIMQRR